MLFSCSVVVQLLILVLVDVVAVVGGSGSVVACPQSPENHGFMADLDPINASCLNRSQKVQA